MPAKVQPAINYWWITASERNPKQPWHWQHYFENPSDPANRIDFGGPKWIKSKVSFARIKEICAGDVHKRRPLKPKRRRMSAAGNVQREELVTVYRAWGLLEAQVIKGRLETAGIPALLDYESAGPAIGITIDGLGEVRVMVPTDRAEEARELIAVRDDEGEDEPEEV